MPLKCNLKHVLIDAKISQTQLAKITGLSRTTISLIANELTEPMLETALIISDAVEKSVNDIWVLRKAD